MKKNIIVRSAIIGGLIGYILVHPIAMIIIKGEVQLDIILKAFSPGHLLMSFYFTLLGVISGIIVGFFQRKLILQNEILKTQKNLIEESADEKDALLRILTHDLSNHIGISKNFLELEIENFEKGSHNRFKDNLNIITKSLGKACDLMNTSKELIAIECGKIEIIKTKHDLIKLLTEVNSLFKVHSVNKNIKIIFNQTKQNVFVNIEPILFQYAIMGNLLNNAIKFSEKGKDVIIESKQNNNQVTIEVINFGPGIPPSKIDNIFSIKEQTTTLGTAGEKGTGLGLPMVYKFIKVMDGEIGVESRKLPSGLYENKFIITLPAVSTPE